MYALRATESTSSGEQILIVLAILAIVVAVLIAVIPLTRRWLLYLSRPLTVTFDDECMASSPDPQNPWQQVRLKVSAKPMRPVKRTKLSLVGCNDANVLVDQELKLKDDNLPERPDARDTDRMCSWRHPEIYDLVLHRPTTPSTIEYKDPWSATALWCDPVKHLPMLVTYGVSSVRTEARQGHPRAS
jgi:hypothetical protein